MRKIRRKSKKDAATEEACDKIYVTVFSDPEWMSCVPTEKDQLVGDDHWKGTLLLIAAMPKFFFFGEGCLMVLVRIPLRTKCRKTPRAGLAKARKHCNMDLKRGWNDKELIEILVFMGNRTQGSCLDFVQWIRMEFMAVCRLAKKHEHAAGGRSERNW